MFLFAQMRSDGEGGQDVGEPEHAPKESDRAIEEVEEECLSVSNENETTTALTNNR